MFRRLCSFGAPSLLLPIHHNVSDTIVISDDDDGDAHLMSPHHQLYSNAAGAERLPAHCHNNATRYNYSSTDYSSDYYNTSTDTNITQYAAGYIPNVAGYGSDGFNLFPADRSIATGHDSTGMLPHHNQAISHNERRQALRQPVRATDLGFESAIQSTPLRSNDRHIACPANYPQPTNLHQDTLHPTSYRETGNNTFRPNMVSEISV